MPPRLPPPDPNEPSAAAPVGLPVAAPAAIFLKGLPSEEQDRLCDAILDYRPGLLLVCVSA